MNLPRENVLTYKENVWCGVKEKKSSQFASILRQPIIYNQIDLPYDEASLGNVQSWIQTTGIHHLLLTMIKVMTQSGRMLKRERRARYHSCISYVIGGPDCPPAVQSWGMEERARKHVGKKKQKGKRKKAKKKTCHDVWTPLLLERGSKIAGKQVVMPGHCKRRKEWGGGRKIAVGEEVMNEGERSSDWSVLKTRAAVNAV